MNLVDIQDDEKLCVATHILQEVCTLLHYGHYCRSNLDDLHFVDHKWICDLLCIFAMVKVTQRVIKSTKQTRDF